MKIRIKKGTCSCVLLCMLLYILACFSYGMSDYSQYITSYNRILNGITTGYQMEFGYILAEQIGKVLHLSFPVFRGIYIALALTLLLTSIREYAKESRTIVIILYAIYPFLLDVVQMRHLMAVAITIYCIRYLKIFNKGNVIHYCIGMLLAVSQHTIAVFYFAFIIIYKKIDIKKFYKSILLILSIEIIAMFSLTAGGVITRIYDFLFSRLLAIRGAGAFSLVRTDAPLKYYVMMAGILLFLSLIIFDHSNTNIDNINKETDRLYDVLLKVSLISLTFIPFVNINDHLARANRGLFVIIYIVFVKYAERKLSVSLRRFLYKLLPLGLAVLCFFMFLSPRSASHWETVTIPILSNNYFIEAIMEK